MQSQSHCMFIWCLISGNKNSGSDFKFLEVVSCGKSEMKAFLVGLCIRLWVLKQFLSEDMD